MHIIVRHDEYLKIITGNVLNIIYIHTTVNYTTSNSYRSTEQENDSASPQRSCQLGRTTFQRRRNTRSCRSVERRTKYRPTKKIRLLDYINVYVHWIMLSMLSFDDPWTKPESQYQRRRKRLRESTYVLVFPSANEVEIWPCTRLSRRSSPLDNEHVKLQRSRTENRRAINYNINSDNKLSKLYYIYIHTQPLYVYTKYFERSNLYNELTRNN